MVALLTSACTAIHPTVQPSGSPETRTPDAIQLPSSSPAHDPLTTSGWFRLTKNHPDQDSLAGFTLDTGTLDGRLARTVSVKFGPLSPSRAYRGALPLAAGPFGDYVLYAYWDGLKSELHSVSVTTGEDVAIVQRDDIIHALTFDPRSGSTFLLTLDPLTKANSGVIRITGDGQRSEELLFKPIDARATRAGDQIWKRLWITPNGMNLVLVDCPSECVISSYSMTGAKLSQQGMQPGQDVVGVTDDAVVAVFGCESPCPATSYDFDSGAAKVGTFCEAATIVRVEAAPFLISDRPVRGDCRTTAYSIGRTSLSDGRDTSVVVQTNRDRTLVTNNDVQGVAPPEGWFVIGPAGQLVGSAAQQQVSPLLVRAIDGAVIPLPLIGSGGRN